MQCCSSLEAVASRSLHYDLHLFYRACYYLQPYTLQLQGRTKPSLLNSSPELIWASFWLRGVWLGIVLGPMIVAPSMQNASHECGPKFVLWAEGRAFALTPLTRIPVAFWSGLFYGPLACIWHILGIYCNPLDLQ